MKKAQLLPSITLALTTLTSVLASDLLVKTGFINRGTTTNPQILQVSISDNCVKNSVIPCTVTIDGVTYQVYCSATAAANFTAALRYMHP